MTNESLPFAGQQKRLLNMLVDNVTILMLWMVLSYILITVGFNQTYTSKNGDEMPILPLVIFPLTYWGYYMMTEFIFQRTLGKVFTRTRVVTTTGGKPTFPQILGRTFSRSIPFEYVSFLEPGNGIHDKLSGTRVIVDDLT